MCSFIAVWVYNSSNSSLDDAAPPPPPPDREENEHQYTAVPVALDPVLLWKAMIFLELCFIISFFCFLRTIVKGYIPTFFTTMTAKQFAVECFHLSTSDQGKFRIFKYNRAYHESIKEELRVWLQSNWEKWTVEEKPPWFTPKLLASIPEELLPIEQLTPKIREQRRKSIIMEQQGSVTGSMRRFSVQLGLGGETREAGNVAER